MYNYNGNPQNLNICPPEAGMWFNFFNFSRLPHFGVHLRQLYCMKTDENPATLLKQFSCLPQFFFIIWNVIYLTLYNKTERVYNVQRDIMTFDLLMEFWDIIKPTWRNASTAPKWILSFRVVSFLFILTTPPNSMLKVKLSVFLNWKLGLEVTRRKKKFMISLFYFYNFLFFFSASFLLAHPNAPQPLHSSFSMAAAPKPQASIETTSRASPYWLYPLRASEISIIILMDFISLKKRGSVTFADKQTHRG